MARDFEQLKLRSSNTRRWERTTFYICSNPRKASPHLSLPPQQVTACLLTVWTTPRPHGPVPPTPHGGWIRQCPKLWVGCAGAEPLPAQAETPQRQPSSSWQHGCRHNAPALVTLENVALPFFYRFENVLQRDHEPHIIGTKAKPEESALLKFKEQGSSRTGKWNLLTHKPRFWLLK